MEADRRAEYPRAGSASPGGANKENAMLWTIAVILAVLWLLGLVSSYTIGGFIHILLVLAIITVLIRVIQGRRLTNV
jgi:hypothetical protein